MAIGIFDSGIGGLTVLREVRILFWRYCTITIWGQNKRFNYKIF